MRRPVHLPRCPEQRLSPRSGAGYARRPCVAAVPVLLAAARLALLLPLAACGGSKSDGRRRRRRPPSRRPTTTTPGRPVAHRRRHRHRARGRTCYDEPAGHRPVDGRPTPAVRRRRQLPAIPRPGLNSAGVAKIDDGYTYENPTYFKNPLVFRVTEDDGDWLQVAAAGPPQPHRGLDPRSDVTLSEIHTHIELSEVDVPPEGVGRRPARGRDRRGDRQGHHLHAGRHASSSPRRSPRRAGGRLRAVDPGHRTATRVARLVRRRDAPGGLPRHQQAASSSAPRRRTGACGCPTTIDQHAGRRRCRPGTPITIIA